MSTDTKQPGYRHILRWGAEVTTRLSAHTFFIVAQQGILFAFPLILIGALTLSLSLLPFPFIHNIFRILLGENWHHLLDVIVNSTYGIASLAILCGMAYAFAQNHNEKDKSHHVSPVATTVMALACMFSIIAHTGIETWYEILSLPKGFLLATFSATIASTLFIYLTKTSRFRIQHSSISGSLTAFESLRLLPASIVTIVILNLFFYLILAFFPAHPGAMLSDTIIAVARWLDNDLIMALTYSLSSQVLWFFGIHGPNVLMPVETSFLAPALSANILHIQNMAPPQHIISKTFLDVFALMGGSGSTLCLIAAILWKSSDQNLRKLVTIALLPALMNVNEPILFGIPVLFNPLYAVPFILTPIIQICVAYMATVLGLIPIISTEVHWTCPTLLSGYLATGNSLTGPLLQFINILVGIALYVPFVSFMERVNARERSSALIALNKSLAEEEETIKTHQCINQPNTQGIVARHLAHDLELALNGDFPFELAYQPQIDTATNRMIGAEALLRWRHPVYGMVPPPVIIAIAEDIEQVNELGLMIIHKACENFHSIRNGLPDDFVLSINLSPVQLQEENLANRVLDMLDYYDIPPSSIELEITETITISPCMATLNNLRELRHYGIQIAIDDFGMGHASLRYLRELPVDTIKIDKSLSDEIRTHVSEYVISSIMNFSQALDIRVVVEGVECKKNLDRLRSIGCRVFQGYYFSKPLSIEAIADFSLPLQMQKVPQTISEISEEALATVDAEVANPASSNIV